MLLNAELCIVFSQCEHGTTVCASCLCLCAGVRMYLQNMQSFVGKLRAYFRICVQHETHYMGLHVAVCECQTVSKESDFTNAEGALHGEAVALCLLQVGTVPEN